MDNTSSLKPSDIKLLRLAARAELLRLLRDTIAHPQPDIVLDVGAHVGNFGKLIRECGYTGPIDSYEPVASSFERLASASDDDPNWRVFPFAISTHTGTLKMFVPGDATNFSSSLAASDVGRSYFSVLHNNVAVINVPCLSISDLLISSAANSVFLKLDVQGLDLSLIMSLENSWSSISYILMEIPIDYVYKSRVELSSAILKLKRYGFYLAYAVPAAWHPESARPIEYDALFLK